MDRSREARRTTMAATNGLPRRRHRSSGLRDSPEEDGAVELQETARLRDRGSGGKKDRDRDRDRERERDRDRERDRERDRTSRSKRRRGGERLGGDESSEESVNDEEEDDDDGLIVAPVSGGSGSLRMLPPMNPASATASMSLMNHHHNNHSHNHHSHNHHSSNNQRKSFPPAKSFRAPPAALKAADEMIGVSVPRKARSVSTKRSHEWSSSAIGIVGDQIHRQASTSPVRPSLSATVSAAVATASASQAPVSPPSSSNASVRKKLKPIGPKLRQPKPSPKPSSSAQEEIEIEIAEVLYGMMRQPQGPSKQEIMANDSVKLDSREANNKSTSDANKSSSDAKSRVSSPISNSQYGAPQSSSRTSQPGGDSTVPAWAFCVAPKRKKPRLVKYDGKYEDAKPSFVPSQTNPISSTAKIPTDQSTKTDTSSSNLEKNVGSAGENGGIASDTAQSLSVPSSSEAQPEPIKMENSLASDSTTVAAEKSEVRDLGLNKAEPQSPQRDSPGHRLDDKRVITTATKTTNLTASENESQREEKFQIDLMAPPPSRSSPERDSETDFVAVEAKPMAIDTETDIKPVIKEDAKVSKLGRREAVEPANVQPEKPKAAILSATSTVEESESKKPPAVVGKERNIDLQLDLEKSDIIRENVSVGIGGNKLHQLVLPRQHHQPPPLPPSSQLPQPNEKPAQSGALPLPTMPMAAWPGGLPPMGYMTPLQGVVSMDGSAVSSPAIQPQPYIFNQPRPKRCATHCYIARCISVHQQIARMNSFWPAAAAAGSGPLYGSKPCNLNVLPSSADMHASISSVRGVNPVQDKSQGLAMFPGHNGKDKASQAAAGVVDSAQRKQILLQQALPPGAPTNLLQGPAAIIFPLSQQQAVAAAAAASVRPGSVKSPPAAGNATTSSGSNSTAVAASATAAAATAGAPAMTFNYPNMAGNEHPPYLAINAYSFPIPAHVGAPSAYRGAHPQAMPFFNGSFYSTFHPSQLPQQQPPAHSQQSQQGHQNPSMSSGSSSSQKHLQNQQQPQRQSHAGGVNPSGGGSLQGFPTAKTPPSQAMQPMQQRQQRGQHISHPARQLESEMGSEDSPSTADSRVSRPSMSIYGQNFAMPIHTPPNFALMTPGSIAAAGVANGASGAGANGSSGGNGEKQSQQQGQKGSGVEPSQAFAMSFGAINGATPGPPGIDITSLAQQQAIFPDIRQGYQQYMAAAAAAVQAQAAAQHKKNYGGPEDGKAGGDSSNVEEDRKAMKGSSGVSHSIAFSRPDLSDASGNALPGANVVDSSARTLNLASTQQRSSGSIMPVSMTNANTSSAQQQLQRNQQQHIIQLQKQQQQLQAAARTKTPPTSNGNVYSDHLSSSMAAKFPNTISPFPQSLVHSSSSPAHSPQWKNPSRSTTAQVPSPSMTSSTSSSLKNLSQQQGRPQQTHTQISFAASNPKPSATQSSGLQPVNSSQSPSPPIMVGSPTTSVSKSAGGSPRTATNSASTGNKVGQTSSLSSQQGKNSPSVTNMKSSPATGKTNAPSILGNPHITSSASATGAKSQLPCKQIQQAQMYFSPNYIPMQAHSNSITTTTAVPGGYYTHRRRPEQQQGGPGTASSGILSLSPSVTLPNTSTSDPAKAVAAASMKGLPSQAIMHQSQFAAALSQNGNPHAVLPAGFSYVQHVPAAVQVKPTEQKQPAGE